MSDKHRAIIQEMARRWTAKFAKPLRGCPDSEINQVQKRQRVPYLPPIYREFLHMFGRESGELARIYGDEFRYPYVLDFKQKAIPIILEKLPDDIFVFWTNYENALFFHTGDKNDDPIVFHITDDETDDKGYVITEKGRLSQWFLGITEFDLS
jgi:hypothetical protein